MRILLLGDVHGNVRHLERSVRRAAHVGIVQVLQLGDFGFWEHDPTDTFMDDVAGICEAYGVALDWIDGNHECHPLLRSRYGPRGDRRHADSTPDAWRIRSPLLTYRPRASRWQWGGRTFLGLGGAYSIDKECRTVGRSWWHEEMITRDEADRAIEGGGVDVMVTHDVVREATTAMSRQRYWKAHHLTDANRDQLQRVKDRVRPRIIVHGHYHVRYRERLDDGTRVYGLASDGEGHMSWGILETDTLSVIDVPYDEEDHAQ